MLFRLSHSHSHWTIRAFLAAFLFALLAGVPFVDALTESPRDQTVAREPSAKQSTASFIFSPQGSPFFVQDNSSNDIWQVIEETSIAGRTGREIIPQAYLTLHLNKDALQNLLRQAPFEFTDAARDKELVMTLPLPDGRISRFRIEESPIMAPELAAKFPEIKTYRGQGIDDRSATIRFDVMPNGFHAQVLSAQETVYVDPYGKGDTENYLSYFKRDFSKDASFACLVGALETGAGVSIAEAQMTVPLVVPPNGTTLRNYRLALGATGEYTIAAGGTVPLAMARMTTSMNRVNGIYERELALRMTLVANNNMLIYTDPNTDPYTNNDVTAMMAQHQTNADTLIGTANYDMGHVFGTDGGGTARVRSTCNSTFKGQGATGLPSPVGDPFDVDFVAHEMGHQHGGLHTFNTSTGSCVGFRNMISAFEPGSGSTPMSYVGTCAPNNLQRNGQDNFHVRSLEEMVAHMTGAGNCAAQTATGNTPPTVNAGTNFTIPRNTPFALTASASDANADAITYAWEEYDLGPIAPPEGDADGMARPIFRTYPPTANPTRTFPSLAYILNNANVPPATYACGQPALCITGESLPNITRTMNFQVTARDNRAGGGGIVSAQMQVSVNAGAGPFVVTQPNTAVSWTGGTQQNVLWDVAATTAAPISAATVNILLSTDGGNTFPTVLAAGTANDGTEAITVPNLPTTTARIKVEAAGNIFFDISGANFSIVAGTPPAMQFSAANYNIGEGDTSVVVTVNRSGDSSGSSTVDFASSNGTASQLRDYQVANGTVAFTAGQTSRTFRVLIVDDVFTETNETVNLTLSNPTGGTLIAPTAATVTIVDNDSSGSTSPLARQFVANLTGAAEVPATPNTVKDNGGVVQLSNDELSAKTSLLFSGLTGSETGAHIHAGAIGVNGPIIFPLPLGNPINNFVVNPSAQQVADLRAGQQYMNVHSSSFLNGEIRGQLQWNPAEEADFFVRQAYFDFLSRVPDPGGFNFWVGEITNCQSDVECLRRKRVDVSNAFFYEQEFQQTAAYVLRLYRAAYGNNQPFPNPNPNAGFPNEEKKMPSYAVFVADRARVVGGANLAQKQLDLANLFATRPEFVTKYPASLATADQFVDAVLGTLQTDLGVNLSGQRANLINLYNTQGGRGAVMYRLVDDNATNPIANQLFINAEYNRSFVLGQYFGYLRRNPDIPGFVFWLGQVNGAPLRDVPRQHAMVCSFITSTEFQLRFGPVASRNNNECPQ